MIHDLFVASALTTCLITFFLVFACDYEDGLFGRIALSIISVSELVVFMDAVDSGNDYSGILKTTLALQLGVTMFFVWHVSKYLIRRKMGGAEWRPARK